MVCLQILDQTERGTKEVHADRSGYKEASDAKGVLCEKVSGQSGSDVKGGERTGRKDSGSEAGRTNDLGTVINNYCEKAAARGSENLSAANTKI